MDIKTLKEIIKDLPDEMRVGGIGHYGEFLEGKEIVVYPMLERKGRKKEKILSIKIEWEGEEPE